jgi:hypothetical protein
MIELDYETVQQIRREVRRLIDRKKEHLVYSVDTIEKLQYTRGEISSLEELLQVMKDLLKNEDKVDDDDLSEAGRL